MTLPSLLAVLPADSFSDFGEFSEYDGFPSEEFGTLGGPGPVFGAIFAIVPVLVGLGFVAVVVLVVLNAVRLRRKGINPLASDAEIVADALRDGRAAAPAPGQAQAARATAPTAPSRSVTDRLAEVDRLHAAGTISDTEREAQRTRILGEV